MSRCARGGDVERRAAFEQLPRPLLHPGLETGDDCNSLHRGSSFSTMPIIANP
jgi:hypothetical protein